MQLSHLFAQRALLLSKRPLSFTQSALLFSQFALQPPQFALRPKRPAGSLPRRRIGDDVRFSIPLEPNEIGLQFAAQSLELPEIGMRKRPAHGRRSRQYDRVRIVAVRRIGVGIATVRRNNR